MSQSELSNQDKEAKELDYNHIHPGLEIDWIKIASAIEFYKSLKWRYVEVPWKVPLSTQQITFPPLGNSDKLRIVGSAEQAFLYQQLNDRIEKGKYLACTPCVRNEEVYSRLRQHWFMKVELYQNYSVNLNSLNKMISDAFLTMSRFIGIDDTLASIKTDEGYDLVLNGVEVGSYGIRKHENIEWIYGTGIAEPRFSTALKMGEENDYREPESLL